jgi:hypothetical protein
VVLRARNTDRSTKGAKSMSFQLLETYHQISDRMNSIDCRLEGFDARFQRTDAKIDALQWRMTSLILASWVTLMVATLFRH